MPVKRFFRHHVAFHRVCRHLPNNANEPFTGGALDDRERIFNDNKIGNDEFISRAKQESEGFDRVVAIAA
jgi:hypothetical protein